VNFLYPIFLIGAVAVGVPIILHMIRRHTHKQQLFSSLMFLKESKPRYQKRSKIEHWLLLLLRCLALLLLALAFTRPFFGKPLQTMPGAAINRKVILIDTSASMRREGLWPQVLSRVNSVLHDVEIDDRLCVMTFDRQPRTLIDFESWRRLEPTQRANIISDQVNDITPTWNPTYLDQAFIAAIRMIEEDEIDNQDLSIESQQIILISDLQQGARLDLLHTFQWPQEIHLVTEKITAESTTNASLTLLAEQNIYSSPEEKTQRRVRITNSPDAVRERFVLNWNSPPELETNSMEVYVPPGQSVVVNIPPAPASLQQLQITGDDHPFDNQHFASAPVRHQLNIIYLGDENIEDPDNMSFYLQKAMPPTRLLDPQVRILPPTESLENVDLNTVGFVIVAEELAPENMDILKRYLQSGKTILVVMKTPELANTICALTGQKQLAAEEVMPDNYAMLSELDLNHPVLKPFDDPRYGDFTQIHFWKYRRLNLEDLPDAHVMARFDNGAPAWLTMSAGAGRLVVLTSGWHPTDSQLARSTKFVPLLYSILEFAGAVRNRQFQYFVGERFQLPPWIKDESSKLLVHRPDNSNTTLDLNQESYFQPDMPGFYTIEAAQNKLLYAVNISAQESQITPMTVEELETFGVSLQPQHSPLPDLTQQARREKANRQALESQQKLWRWILLATTLALLLETVLAGWLSKTPTEAQGVTK